MHIVPAGFADLVALLTANEKLTLQSKHYAALIAQVALSEAFAAYASPRDPHPLAVAGIAPLGDVAGELWFIERHGGLGMQLVPMVRATRRVLSVYSPRYPGGILCLVLPDNPNGERLARLIGFEPTGVEFNGHREWNWKESEHERRSEEGRICATAGEGLHPAR